MKKKKTYIGIAIIVAIFLIYVGYDRWPTEKWKEYRSLGRIWSRLNKEGIKNIVFCDLPPDKVKTNEDGSICREIIKTLWFRVRDANEVKLWHVVFEVPREDLPLVIKTIEKAMKDAEPRGIGGTVKPMIWLEKMLIVTGKGKYLFSVDTQLTNVDISKVYGEDWSSHELAEYLKRREFPIAVSGQEGLQQ